MTDDHLLRAFVAERSAEAFGEIVRRYAGMVFGVALRVTADRAAAEDVAQDCFFKLTQRADQVRDSLPGWLHQVALNRAREFIRGDAARRRHEQAVAIQPDAANDGGTTWADVAPLVDEALADLPEELRVPLVEHFLCGRPQADVAARLGVNQGTISRRIERGLERVREHLRQAGVVTPTIAGLMVLLTSNAVEAAPPTLVAALGKVNLAGTASGRGTGGIVQGISAGKIAIAVACLLALIVAAMLIMHTATQPPQPPGAAAMPVNVNSHVVREGNRVSIDNVPPAAGNGNGYVRGLETMLAHAGTPVNYERLMGLSGIAFITQADIEHRWEGKIDVGWWPLDPWGLQLRRDFLGRAIGCSLSEVGWVSFTSDQYAEISGRLPQVYHEQIEPHVKRSIDAGRPVLAMGDFGFVISGYDGETAKPPVWGRCGWGTASRIDRAESWPIGLLMLGSRATPMNPDEADFEALRFAVALAHDQAGPTEDRWRHRRFTGQKAYAAWASLLRNTDEPLEDRHHANMKFRLRDNRTAAVAYLRGIAERRQGDTAEALRKAVSSYERVLQLLATLRPEGLAANHTARRDMADVVDRIAIAEAEAVQEIERALTMMKP